MCGWYLLLDIRVLNTIYILENERAGWSFSNDWVDLLVISYYIKWGCMVDALLLFFSLVEPSPKIEDFSIQWMSAYIDKLLYCTSPWFTWNLLLMEDNHVWSTNDWALLSLTVSLAHLSSKTSIIFKGLEFSMVALNFTLMHLFTYL